MAEIGLTGIDALEAETRDRLADRDATIERLIAENERLLRQLGRVKAFLDGVDGDGGLTAGEVDRLCGIAHGRTDLSE